MIKLCHFQIECNAPKSYPASESTIQWLTASSDADYVDARPLHTDGRLIMNPDGSLEFAYVKDIDHKKYWCEVRNKVSGETQAGEYNLVELTNGKDLWEMIFRPLNYFCVLFVTLIHLSYYNLADAFIIY